MRLRVVGQYVQQGTGGLEMHVLRSGLRTFVTTQGSPAAGGNPHIQMEALAVLGGFASPVFQCFLWVLLWS
jgi:hypothetical protein